MLHNSGGHHQGKELSTWPNMASSSECITSFVTMGQATLEQIKEEEASFYGASEETEDFHMPTTDDDSEEVFLSEDEAQSSRFITSMSTPSGSAVPLNSMTQKWLGNLRKGVDVVNSAMSNSMFLRSRNID